MSTDFISILKTKNEKKVKKRVACLCLIISKYLKLKPKSVRKIWYFILRTEQELLGQVSILQRREEVKLYNKVYFA